MFSMLLTSAALLSAAIAAPLATRQQSRVINTGLMSVRSASPIHFQEVNATANTFWIGKPTTTFCPYDPPEQTCNYPNGTVVSIYPDATEYQVYMYDNVPGGQNVYVGPDGALSFTTAHTEYVFPNGSYTNGFTYTTDPENVSFLIPAMDGATSWFACPAVANQTPTSYKVFADTTGFTDAVTPTGNKNDCLSFGMVVANENNSDQTLAAWQYE